MTSKNFSATTRNVTVDEGDKSIILNPLYAWGRSDQGQGLTGGTFSFSNTENATAVFRFPQNATGFMWRGFLRSGPALYSLCIDCTDPAEAEIVDGHSCHRNSTELVTTLFSKTDLTNSGHTITITNLVDPRFGVASQITIDSFIFVVPSASSSVVSPSSSSRSIQTLTTFTSTGSTSAPSVVVTAMSDAGSPTAAAYWSKSSSTTGLSTGAIVGAAFAGAFALLGVLVFGWWLLRRKHAYGKLDNVPYGEKKSVPDPESPMSTILKLPPSNEEQPSVVKAPPPPNDSSPSFAPHFLGPSEAYRSKHVSKDHFQSPRKPIASQIHTPNPSDSNGLVRPIKPPQWGIIPVRFYPTEDATKKDEQQVNDESDFDFDTPYPSSEIGTSSFIMSDLTDAPGNHVDNEAPAPALGLELLISNRASPDSTQTPPASISRGWRRI